MLRRSNARCHTPIIVFSRNLFIQRIKAQLFGATKYLVAQLTENNH
ncbi:hypothetical protein [Chlorogloea sp. CCALA 695]|nr:hypothetical protein [Chlorogloea sp. CCALA 695]